MGTKADLSDVVFFFHSAHILVYNNYVKRIFNMNDTRPSWDETWMSIVYDKAKRSHDPSTHVGAVCVTTDNIDRMTGYNGLSPGIEPDDHPELLVSPVKYDHMNHAEFNLIGLASKMGVSTNGCRVYQNMRPCFVCLRLMWRSGIVEVVYHKQFSDLYDSTRPEHTYKADFALIDWFTEKTGMLVRSYDGPVGNRKGFLLGNPFDLD
jgi:dCMP deaminase